MGRTIAYWASTAIAALALLGSLSYLTGSEQVVSGFAKAGCPQHLRIVLGIAKPAAAFQGALFNVTRTFSRTTSRRSGAVLAELVDVFVRGVEGA